MAQTQERLTYSDPPARAVMADSGRRAKRRVFWLKVIVTVAVFAVIAVKVGWFEVGERLQKANIAGLFAALVTLAASIVVASLRWSILARRHGAALRYGVGIRVTFAAQFFGQVLPSTVGVDAARSWIAVRYGLPGVPVVASVIVDRICGLLGLSFLIIVGLPRLLSLSGMENSLVIAFFSLVFAIGVAGSVTILLMCRKWHLAGFLGRIQQLLVGSAEVLASSKGLGAVGLSAIVQGLVILSVVLIAWSIDLPLSLVDGFAIVPATMLIAIVPVTINGWGLREGAMITAMGLVGISSADALVVSVLFGVLLLLASLPGAPAYFLLKNSK